MKDVEELLRETLTDPRRNLHPGPGLYEAVHERAHAVRRRRSAIALASVAAVAVVTAGSVVGLRNSGHRAVAPVATPTSSAVRSPTAGGLSDVALPGMGWATVATVTNEGLYVVTTNPDQLVKLDVDARRILTTAPGPGGESSGLTIGDGRVWAWVQSKGDLYAYDAASLLPLGSYHVDAQIFDAVAIDGYLYLTTAHGLLRANATPPTSGQLTTTAIADIDRGTYGLAADPARHRVLVGVTPLAAAPTGGFAGVRVVAVDARTGKVTAQSPQTHVGKESIAVVGDQVWVAGYGDAPLIEHLDARTLRVIGTSAVGQSVGPGAIVWPGANVLWVRSGGDERLSCVDAKTGAILEQWPEVQGPVTSVPGHAYGITPSLKALGLVGNCTG